MREPLKSPWNSLEIVKLIFGLLTPILILILGYQVNQSLKAADEARAEAMREAQRIQKELDESRQLARTRETALANYSRLIYGRRVRSELLASSLNRHAKQPVVESKQELIERKRAYDDAYADWNANTRANLLLVRAIVDPKNYSNFENLVEFRLSKTFSSLDACLTKGYDIAIRAGDPRPILTACDAPKLIQRSLDCGYAVIDELYKVSSLQANISSAASIIEKECPTE